MKLRKPCEHGVYDEHVTIEGVVGVWLGPLSDPRVSDCPGGEFLPEDALVIEKDADDVWPEWALEAAEYESNDLGGEGPRILDSLAAGPDWKTSRGWF